MTRLALLARMPITDQPINRSHHFPCCEISTHSKGCCFSLILKDCHVKPWPTSSNQKNLFCVNAMSQLPWASCLTNLWEFCHTSWICNFINSPISWVRSFPESNVSDTNNLVLLENTTPINLINLLWNSFILTFLFWFNRSGIFERYNVVNVR